MKPRIAVLGTGRMGTALAGTFLANDYRTTVWNRTRAKCEPLAASGATVASSPLEAVQTGDVIVLIVTDYIASRALLEADGLADALRGKLLLQLTSGTPRQARELAAWADGHGIAYLDGVIMNTPTYIGSEHCSILYAGAQTVFQHYRPLLQVFGGTPNHVGGDAGHAAALDCALLIHMWGAMFAALQGAAICRAEDYPLDTYLESVKPLLPLVNGWVMDCIERIRDGRLAGDATTDATLETHSASLRHLIDLCREASVHHDVPEAYDRLFQAALADGHGKDDFAVLSRYLR